MTNPQPHPSPWRAKIFEIIFGSHTPVGRTFDILLIGLIVASVLAVSLESVVWVRDRYLAELRLLEYGFTAVFTVEYVLRLLSVRRKREYAFSFFGWVDLLSILPTFLSALFPGAQYLLVVRFLRVLRVFRVLKLTSYMNEASQLGRALSASRRKIFVFIYTVMTVVTILGSLMYLVEGGDNGFTSIPKSVYWAVVTLTTVGYGDISPATPLGQALSTVIMILGYGIIAVPTGIVTVELNRALHHRHNGCPRCGLADLDTDDNFCRRCGLQLPTPAASAADPPPALDAGDGAPTTREPDRVGRLDRTDAPAGRL